MNARGRLIVGTIWILVAGLIASTIDPGAISSAAGVVRLFVVVLALFLAAVYLFDPWEVVSGRSFH